MGFTMITGQKTIYKRTGPFNVPQAKQHVVDITSKKLQQKLKFTEHFKQTPNDSEQTPKHLKQTFKHTEQNLLIDPKLTKNDCSQKTGYKSFRNYLQML